MRARTRCRAREARPAKCCAHLTRLSSPVSARGMECSTLQRGWTRRFSAHLVSLNPRLGDHGDAEIDRTLRHELAHLLATVPRRSPTISPHGAEWRKACHDLGIANENRAIPSPSRSTDARVVSFTIARIAVANFPRVRRLASARRVPSSAVERTAVAQFDKAVLRLRPGEGRASHIATIDIAFPSPFAAFCPRNFAWMKRSMSPSMTACTLLVSAPVR